MQQLSFAWLIDPITPETFFRDHYEKAPLLIGRNDPARFASLLSIAAIDRYLATTSPCHPGVFLVDAARDLKPEDYTLANADTDGLLDLPRVYEHFQAGATISIKHLHEGLPELAALCRAVEKVFSAHFQTNIYLSPPNAQGFGTHFDSHDVFVLQVAGSKVWTLNDTAIELPLHGQKFEKDKHIPGQPTRELTIRAGDVFYCPRGLFHSARSTDEVSLHITLGLIGKTWADMVAEAVSAACLASPAFRANLPAGFANGDFDTAKAAATFRSLVESFARTADIKPLLERFAEDFVTSRRPDLSGILHERSGAAAITTDTRVEPRPHLIYRLREEGENVTLLFGSTTIIFPAIACEPLFFALQGRPFAARELPGRLDDAGKVVLVRRLINEGLLIHSTKAPLGATTRAKNTLAPH
jgi:mannose-6-phosphate isomerase-like protein (cupin superfamily)